MFHIMHCNMPRHRLAGRLTDFTEGIDDNPPIGFVDAFNEDIDNARNGIREENFIWSITLLTIRIQPKRTSWTLATPLKVGNEDLRKHNSTRIDLTKVIVKVFPRQATLGFANQIIQNLSRASRRSDYQGPQPGFSQPSNREYRQANDRWFRQNARE